MGSPTLAPEETVKQYELWWALLPPPVGRRPVLLMSRDAAYEFLNNVLIVEVTTTIRRIPQEVLLGSKEGLPRRCVANFDNFHSIPQSTLQRRIGSVAGSRLRELKQAMGSALGWPELTLPDVR